jgi:hypothetical protein
VQRTGIILIIKTMKREQIINKIYDKIRYDLLHAKLLYWEEDDTNKYPLVDHLSSGSDISTGRDEIDNIIEQIEIEDLIDAILALPLDDELLKRELIRFRNYFNNESYGSIEEWIIDEYIENKGINYERD